MEGESIDTSIVSQFLYSDIDETNVPSPGILQEELSASEQRRKELEAKNHELEKKIDILTKENFILKRNISCLFKTAQMEIQRKDSEITKLRQSLEQRFHR